MKEKTIQPSLSTIVWRDFFCQVKGIARKTKITRQEVNGIIFIKSSTIGTSVASSTIGTPLPY
jgi:hypothetical protein